MDKPDISIIISNYNGAETLSRTIESMLSQTFTNWEAVIVDDGSSDDSPKLIEEYARQDARIKPYIRGTNYGMCSGFNYALEKAKGRYFARLDSDDFWEPEKLALQYAYMESHPHCGVCFTHVRIVDENENTVPSELCEYRDRIYNSKNRTQAEWLRTFFTEGCRVCHPTALYRREVIEKVGQYNYIYKQVQDYDLWIRIVKYYEIHIIEKALINYRWFLNGKSNASASNRGVSIRGLFESYLIFGKFFDDVSDKLFLEAFQHDLFNKSAETPIQIACEKALLMYHKSYLGNTGRAIGLAMLDKLFNDPQAKSELEQTYGITTNTYAEWTSYPIFSDSVDQQNEQAEISLKNLLKKHLISKPRAFAFCKRCYRLIRRNSEN